ncbi:MAG: (2Fe-2S) ferredoxin domain-containing protein [Clostridia bacterium]|nr:(2Fe-2S) ferredoxin domain-containing protein [Oscillospiraceae bacterium]MBQ8276425.1 (2Fe-2S) ferredoxin domain-containing protein [Clostridia bacterium]
MKSLAELAAIKAKMKDKVAIREGSGSIRVVVGMATCGIAAGARPVLSAFVDEVNQAGLAEKVTVTQTGCIGICQYEPVVEIFEEGKEKVTYVKMTAEKAARVVAEHIKGGRVVEEFTIGNK